MVKLASVYTLGVLNVDLRLPWLTHLHQALQTTAQTLGISHFKTLLKESFAGLCTWLIPLNIMSSRHIPVAAVSSFPG